ncbi:MAG: accessory factor UbiK family protein [Hyphomicrobiales bacterium]|nr:accessory factor UbiK family protein [Hyphomicrobiales bacterium]
MTQTSNRMFDEFARLMTDAANVAQGVRREAETAFRSQAEKWVADLDLVQREEFEAVRELAANARADNEELQARVAELEARLNVQEEKPARRARTTKRASSSSATASKPRRATRKTTPKDG